MRVLITGITGFVGSHLADLLLDQGQTVIGTARWRSSTANIEHIQDRVELVECDLRDAAGVRDVLADTRPDRIFHLAAQSFVQASWRSPQETISTNMLGQVNIMEALRDLGMNPPMLIAGSSEEYGLVRPDEVPITEDNPLRPLSPYGVSKVGQDLLAFQYHKSYGMHLIRCRAFNHTGPRRGKVFAESNWAYQIVEMEKGHQEPVLRVGNLEAKRDYSDVRDMVKAYALALEKGEPGEVYNLCSGRTYAMKEIVDLLLGMTKLRVHMETDPARLRPSDVPVLLGDYSKFHQRTGWSPQIPLAQTLRDLLEYWRAQ